MRYVKHIIKQQSKGKSVMDITSEQYIAEIKSIAASIVQEIKSNAASIVYDDDEAMTKLDLNDELFEGEWVEKAVDRHKWSLYNSYSLFVLMHTKNDDAFINKYGCQALADFMEQTNESMCGLFNAMARAAMCEDIKEEIERLFQ